MSQNITVNQNFLDYTKLSFTEIVQQITEKLNADPNFENFRESAIAKMVIEIFAATTDLNNFYISRRAEECYFDTAKLKSSIILLARQLGYIVTRPVPAVSELKITLKGQLPSWVVAGDYIQLEAHKQFTFNGNPFLLSNTYTYTFSASDIVNGRDGPNASTWTKELIYTFEPTEDNLQLLSQEDIETQTIPTSLLSTIDILQGELKTKVILGNTNPFVGKKFQVYKINDKTASNKFGGEDYGAVGTVWQESDLNVTFVKIGSSLAGASNFLIDRRSLISYDALTDFDNAQKICLMRTALDETLEIEFGDNNYAEIGAKSTSDNIYVQYLSTLGANANLIGVIDSKIICQSPIYVNNDLSKNITANISFTLNANIKNGANLEDIESIKVNAPGIYYSLDRLVTAGDYVVYLKSLTSSIDIRNAIAWGEQEEGGSVSPKFKLFNIALFCAVGPLYNTDSLIHKVKTIDAEVFEDNLVSAVLDDVDNLYGETENSYFKTFVRETSPALIGTTTSGSNIEEVLTLLNTRSQLTVRNVYVSPFIRDFDLTGFIYVNRLADAAALLIKINNSIYEFLDQYADFNVDIYKSNIVELIENYKEVIYTDIEFVPAELLEGQLTFDLVNMGANPQISTWQVSATHYGNENKANIKAAYNKGVEDWWTIDLGGTYVSWDDITARTLESPKEKITEWSFENQLMKRIYDNLLALIDQVTHPEQVPLCFANSIYFDNLLSEMRNSLLWHIKTNALDSEGNITEYSIKNEIPKLTSKLLVVYKQ